MSGWQDISTHPRNGEDVLVWRPDEGDGLHFAHAAVDVWRKGVWRQSRRKQQPTHWMPLPAGPSEGEGVRS